MLSKDLQKLGLDAKEARAYVAALELGDGTMGQLTKKSGIKRTTLYDVIESLKQRGLLSTAKRDRKTVYVAEDPRTLREGLEEKRQALEKMLPELLSITNFLDNKPKVRYYEGFEGIKDVYKDTLHYPDQELLAWVSDDAIQDFDEEFLNNYYLPRRVAKKIWVRAIAPDRPYMQAYQGLDEKSLRRTKLVSAEQFPLAVEVNLYGRNRIAVMSFAEKLGMIIESQRISTTLKSIFEMNWNGLK